MSTSASPKKPVTRDGHSLRVEVLDDPNRNAAVTPALSTFLHPLSTEDFLADIFRTKAFAVKVHPRTRAARLATIAELMDQFNPTAMLHASNSELIHVWMRVPLPDGQSELASIKLDADQAKQCYQAGHSLYFRGCEALEAAFVPAYLADLGCPGFLGHHRDAARRGEVEVFATRIGHTTSWHSDFQENFTVQLRGRKKWYLQKGAVPHPHRAMATHFADDSTRALLHTQHCIQLASGLASSSSSSSPANGVPADIEETCETVVLQAGDVLYHPAGMWHKCETLDCDGGENSLSINVSLFPMTFGELMMETVQQLVIARPEFRERISMSVLQQQHQRRAQASLLKAATAAATPPAKKRGRSDAAAVERKTDVAEIVDAATVLQQALTTRLGQLSNDLSPSTLRASHVLPTALLQSLLGGDADAAATPSMLTPPPIWIVRIGAKGHVLTVRGDDAAWERLAAQRPTPPVSLLRSPLAVILEVDVDMISVPIRDPAAAAAAAADDDDAAAGEEEADETEEEAEEGDDEDDEEEDDDEEEESSCSSADDDDGAPLDVRFDLCTNFAADEPNSAAAPGLRVSLMVDPAFAAGMASIARLPIGTAIEREQLPGAASLHAMLLHLGFFADATVA